MATTRGSSIAVRHGTLADAALRWTPDARDATTAYALKWGAAHLLALGRREEAEGRLLDVGFFAAMLNAFPTFVLPLKHWRVLGLERARAGYVRTAEGLGANAFVTPVSGIPEGLAWVGGWWSRLQRGPMECRLVLAPDGVVTGDGKDRPGAFTLSGSFTSNGSVTIRKSYGSHSIDYDGQLDGNHGVIEGTWHIGADHGSFVLRRSGLALAWDVLASTRRLGTFLREVGLYGSAQLFFQRLINEYGAFLPASHPDVVNASKDLVVLQRYTGDYELAEEAARSALAHQIRELGDGHGDTENARSLLGVVLNYRGKYAEAEVMLRKSLAFYEAFGGNNVFESASTLATCLQSQGKYAEANLLYRRALAGREQALGPSHPDTLDSLNHLGASLGSQGKYAEAEPLHRRALEGQEQALGPSHPSVLSNRSWQVHCLKALKRNEEAVAAYRQALAGYEHSLGVEHVNTLVAVNNLATMLQAMDLNDEASQLFARVADGRVAAFGTASVEAHAARSWQGHCLKALKRNEEAVAAYRQALAGYEDSLGIDDPATPNVLSCLSVMLQESGRLEESEHLALRAVEGRERQLGLNHPDTLASINNLGWVLVDRRNAEGARQRFVCLETAWHSVDGWQGLWPRLGLALCTAIESGDEAEAEAVITELVAREGVDHPRVATARERLVRALTATAPD